MKYLNHLKSINKRSLSWSLLLSLALATTSVAAAETAKSQGSKQSTLSASSKVSASAKSPHSGGTSGTQASNTSNASINSDSSMNSSNSNNYSASNSSTSTSSSADKSKIGEFCWNELATANLQASKDFYGKVFDWKFTEHPMGDMTYTMINTNGKEFAGMWSIPKAQEAQIQPHWLAYILVENLDQSLEKAMRHGATLIKPATPIGDFGRMAIIKDPTGAHIALWQALKNKNQ